jgi:hypothetical protein
MKKADRIYGVIGLGLALWSYLESTRLTYMTEFTPGPGFFPFWVGVALAILSVYLIIDTYVRKPGPKDDAKVLPEKHMLPTHARPLHGGDPVAFGALQYRQERGLRDRLRRRYLVHIRIHVVHGFPQGIPGNLGKGE